MKLRYPAALLLVVNLCAGVACVWLWFTRSDLHSGCELDAGTQQAYRLYRAFSWAWWLSGGALAAILFYRWFLVPSTNKD